MRTDVYIKIINEKMNKNFLIRWILVIPAIIAFGFTHINKIPYLWHPQKLENKQKNLSNVPRN